MDIPGVQFLLERYVRHAARRDPVLPLPPGPPIRRPRRILVAVTTGMGDIILATPVIDSLRTAFPDAEIALFCRQAWVSLFTGDPDLAAVLPYYGKSRRVWATRAALRRFAPDLVVAPHINDPDILPLLYLSGARQIVRVPWGTTRFSDLLSNQGIEAQRLAIKGLHVVDERLRVVEALGLQATSRIPRLTVEPGLAEALAVRARAATGCETYAVFHVFSADVYRTVPEDLVRTSLAALRAKYPKIGWVLTGSAADRSALLTMTAGLGVGIWVAAGELKLNETAACIRGACAAIAPDTGNLHLAAALDRPVLALFSPTREAPTRAQVVSPRTASAPVQVLEVPAVCDPCVGRRCPHRPVACLQAFRVEDVVERFGMLIRQGEVGHPRGGQDA